MSHDDPNVVVFYNALFRSSSVRVMETSEKKTRLVQSVVNVHFEVAVQVVEVVNWGES